MQSVHSRSTVLSWAVIHSTVVVLSHYAARSRATVLFHLHDSLDRDGTLSKFTVHSKVPVLFVVTIHSTCSVLTAKPARSLVQVLSLISTHSAKTVHSHVSGRSTSTVHSIQYGPLRQDGTHYMHGPFIPARYSRCARLTSLGRYSPFSLVRSIPSVHSITRRLTLTKRYYLALRLVLVLRCSPHSPTRSVETVLSILAARSVWTVLFSTTTHSGDTVHSTPRG